MIKEVPPLGQEKQESVKQKGDSRSREEQVCGQRKEKGSRKH